ARPLPDHHAGRTPGVPAQLHRDPAHGRLGGARLPGRRPGARRPAPRTRQRSRPARGGAAAGAHARPPPGEPRDGPPARRRRATMKALKLVTVLLTALGVSAFVYRPPTNRLDLPNRIPEAAPYITEEAAAYPPPYEEYWQTQNHPGQCQNCHQKIFDEWNGSMMSNSWRDPVWRGAFFLLSKMVSTHGNCDIPKPPDGTPRSSLNPFAKGDACESEFNIGKEKVTLSRPGSLLDAFCSRCHMPTNYLDNIPLRNVKVDPVTGIESAPPDTNFNPTSDNGTGVAYATLESQFRNTESGKTGIFCAVCHSFSATRDTPFHNYERGGKEYNAAIGTESREEILPVVKQDMF